MMNLMKILCNLIISMFKWVGLSDNDFYYNEICFKIFMLYRNDMYKNVF